MKCLSAIRGIRALVAGVSLLMAGVTYGAVTEIYLRADVTTNIMPDGRAVVMWGFAQDSGAAVEDGVVTIPGPTITLGSGSQDLLIHLTNKLAEPVSIVIPGQLAALGDPVRNPDGRVRSFTHEAPSGGTADFAWSNLTAGTYLYHSGSHPAIQVQMGLYGAMKRDAAVGQAYPGVAYTNDVTLVFSEIDPVLHDAVATGNYGPGLAVSSTVDYQPKYFLINGMPYTNGLPHIAAGRAGERILLRILNAGLQLRAPVLNGEQLQLVAEDGNKLPYPRQTYTMPLPPQTTIDAILTAGSPGAIAIYDRRLGLVSGTGLQGGMLTYLDIGNSPVSPDTQGPVVQIVSPTSAAFLTSSTNLINLAGVASDNVGVAEVIIRNNRDIAAYTSTGTTNWQFNGMPLYQGLNYITVTGRDAAGNPGTYTLTVSYTGDTRYNDVLQSGGLIQEIQFPDNLAPGETALMQWKVLSYVPLLARLGTGSAAGGWTLFKNATYTGSTMSPWNIAGRHATVYSFQCDYVVPQHPGDFSLWFNHAQMDGNQYMTAVIPDGVDSRPNLALSKTITRTILAGGTNLNPVSDTAYYDAAHPFETIYEGFLRSGATILNVNIPTNQWRVGSVVTNEWTVMAYFDVGAKLTLLNLTAQTNWLTAVGTQIAAIRSPTWHIGSTYATEYTFRAVFTVPNCPGVQQLYFLNCQQSVANSSWMSGNIQAGADPRPALYNGTFGRFIERTVVP